MKQLVPAPRASPPEPTSLRLGQRGEAPEHEAERAAEQVLSESGARPAVSPIPATTRTLPLTDDRFARDLAAQGGGAPLSAPARARFEPRFGRDLSGMRLHEGPSVDALARRIGARGFAHGRHIYLRTDAASERLMAHELAHALQQGNTRGLIQRDEDETLPQPVPTQATPGQAQPAQAPAPPAAPSTITFSFGNNPIPVPPAGTVPLTATSDQPATTVWSLSDGSTPVAAGTTISAAGRIRVGAAQQPGTITVNAADATGAGVTLDMTFSARPTGITSTSLVSQPSGEYGHVFDHVLTSSSGKVAELEGVPIGEKFPLLATPNAATHDIPPPTFPFGGTFTLHTATLTPDASNNWFATSSGSLGGTFDTVSLDPAGIDVGRFVRSKSNPSPPAALPQSFSVEQHLHWFNPMAASPWVDFRTVTHKRELSEKSGVVTFTTTVNKLGDGGDAYTGPIAPRRVAATPATTPASTAAPASPPPGAAAPAARTVALTVDTLPDALPTGQSLSWSIEGPDLGCTIAANATNPKQATLTVGTTAGKVTIRVTDGNGNNFDETVVTIT